MSATDLLFGFGETTLAIAALIAVILIIRRPFAKIFGARAAYLLWFAPLARLLLPELKIMPARALEEIAYVSATVVTAPQSVPIEASIDWIAIAAGAALFLWIAVAFALMALHIESHKRVFREAVANSIPAGRALRGEARRVAVRLGLRREPEVRLYADENGPMVIGALRPVVFLPASFENAFNARERRLALAHEFAHIARGDLVASLAGAFLQAVQWPNPLIHFASGAFRTDQEAACDAYVLARCGGAKAAVDYASAILKSIRGEKPAYGLSLGHPLKERLMLLKDSNASLRRRLLGGLGAAALITAGLAATANYGYAASDEKAGADEVGVEKEVVRQKRVLVFTGAEDEVIFDDVVVGDRVRVMQFGDEDGERRIIRIANGEKTVRVYDKNGVLLTEDVSPIDSKSVRVFDKDGNLLTENVSAPGDGNLKTRVFADGEKHVVIDMEKQTDGHMTHANCTGDSAEGEPVMLEFKEESGEDGNKSVYHTIICLTGDDAKPENRAAALDKAIENLEKQAKEEEARRKKMIQSLKKQAKELEKQK